MTSWLQTAAYAFSIIWGIGAAAFTLFVLWPSIRKQEAFFKKVEQQQADKIIDQL